MTPLDAAASIVLLEFRQSYGLGFVAPNGRIVTSYHVVSDEPEILAHLADGRAIPVRTVSALDVRRDLAVLDVGVLDAPPVKTPGPRLADEGARAFIFGMVAEEGRARWVDAKLAAVQVLGTSLTVYRVEGEIPPDASGGPLIAEDGTALGVVTVAESDDGVVTLGVPWKYVVPLLLQDQQQPLSSLASAAHEPPRREVPNHPVSMLEGSAMAGLEATTEILAGAIRRGAPAYNEGNVEKCYQLYADAARQLINTRDDCPGVQTALQAGLSRAAAMADVDRRAWAMRDTFDGLLSVIERYMRSHLGHVKKPSKPTLLN